MAGTSALRAPPTGWMLAPLASPMQISRRRPRPRPRSSPLRLDLDPFRGELLADLRAETRAPALADLHRLPHQHRLRAQQALAERALVELEQGLELRDLERPGVQRHQAVDELAPALAGLGQESIPEHGGNPGI